jgi:hypothetical protein
VVERGSEAVRLPAFPPPGPEVTFSRRFR